MHQLKSQDNLIQNLICELNGLIRSSNTIKKIHQKVFLQTFQELTHFFTLFSKLFNVM